MIDLIDYIGRCSSRESTYRLADFFNRWWDEYAQHPCGVHHSRTVQGGERYPCVPYSRFGNRHIRLPRLRGRCGKSVIAARTVFARHVAGVIR